jgi:imidazolonepropionase-like amidohydrolase
MKWFGRVAWGGFLAVSLAGVLPSICAQNASPAAVPVAGRIAVIHARAYLTPGEDPIDDATILIEGGKVRASGAGLAAPAGFRVIDAKGAIVTPGLMNSNSRMALTETEGEENTDSGVSSGPFGEAFDPTTALNANTTVIPIVRADGLTRAAVLPTGSAAPPFSGEALLLVLREGPDILDQPRAAVVVHVGGMLVNSTGGSRAAQWLLLRDALDAAAHNGKPGASVAPAGFIGVTQENLTALKPVLDGKIPLVIEASRESDLRQAIALVDDYKIHVVLLGAEEGWRVAPLLASHHIAAVINPFTDSPTSFDQIGARLDNAAILDKAGVLVSIEGAFVSVTFNAGMATREGAGLAVANGMPWNHALRAITSGAAETWGIADRYGTLQPGKDADLVIWDGDPLEPITNPVLVMVQGREVSLDNRQRMLERRYAPDQVNSNIPAGYRH